MAAGPLADGRRGRQAARTRDSCAPAQDPAQRRDHCVAEDSNDAHPERTGRYQWLNATWKYWPALPAGPWNCPAGPTGAWFIRGRSTDPTARLTCWLSRSAFATAHA